MKSRRVRKSRKVRKQKKSRKGGYPTPINVQIPFTVSNGNLTFFRPNFAFLSPETLREMFISAIFDHIHGDEPMVDMYSQNVDVLEDKNANVQIHRIRGTEDTIEFDGNIKNWTDEQIKNFAANLLAGDTLNIETITIIE
jgi:hypothetical protein